MAKKDYSAALAPESLQAVIEEATTEKRARKPRRTASDEEIQAAQMAMRTRGVKGAELQRINMAFAPDVYDYIHVMSVAGGETMTQFVNRVLRLSMENNKDLYDKAKIKADFLSGLK